MFSHRGLGWVSRLQKAISMSAGAGWKTKFFVGKEDPREQEKLEPVPISTMQLSPTKWHFPVARTGPQVPKNCRLKSVYSTKSWEDEKLGWRGLLHSHIDNMETPHFVLTLFQFLSCSLPYISKWRAIFTWPKWIAFTRKICKRASSPYSKGKLNLTPPFLRVLQWIDVSFKKCQPVLHRAYLILCLGQLCFVAG